MTEIVQTLEEARSAAVLNLYYNVELLQQHRLGEIASGVGGDDSLTRVVARMNVSIEEVRQFFPDLNPDGIRALTSEAAFAGSVTLPIRTVLEALSRRLQGLEPAYFDRQRLEKVERLGIGQPELDVLMMGAMIAQRSQNTPSDIVLE